MTRSCRCLIATVCIASACSGLFGCSSSVGTGNKKADEATFKGGPMPPEAMAKMQAAMSHAGSKASEPHGPSGNSAAAGGAPGQSQAQAGQEAAASAAEAARNRAMQNRGGN